MDDKVKKINQNDIEIRAFAYDWIIAFSIIFLVSIISLPPIIWNEKN